MCTRYSPGPMPFAAPHAGPQSVCHALKPCLHLQARPLSSGGGAAYRKEVSRVSWERFLRSIAPEALPADPLEEDACEEESSLCRRASAALLSSASSLSLKRTLMADCRANIPARRAGSSHSCLSHFQSTARTRCTFVKRFAKHADETADAFFPVKAAMQGQPAGMPAAARKSQSL